MRKLGTRLSLKLAKVGSVPVDQTVDRQGEQTTHEAADEGPAATDSARKGGSRQTGGGRTRGARKRADLAGPVRPTGRVHGVHGTEHRANSTGSRSRKGAETHG